MPCGHRRRLCVTWRPTGPGSGGTPRRAARRPRTEAHLRSEDSAPDVHGTSALPPKTLPGPRVRSPLPGEGQQSSAGTPRPGAAGPGRPPDSGNGPGGAVGGQRRLRGHETPGPGGAGLCPVLLSPPPRPGRGPACPPPRGPGPTASVCGQPRPRGPSPSDTSTSPPWWPPTVAEAAAREGPPLAAVLHREVAPKHPQGTRGQAGGRHPVWGHWASPSPQEHGPLLRSRTLLPWAGGRPGWTSCPPTVLAPPRDSRRGSGAT